jgi:tRNA acetyltransferase TAN1
LLILCDKKFAIRPSIRNNKELTRDEVIRTVAAIVGPGHKVDLHGYDLLILVEIYKVCFRFV